MDSAVKVQPPERSEELDAALGLQMISIRLPAALIDDLKFCARAHGMPYQALTREMLIVAANREKREITKAARARGLSAAVEADRG